LDCVRDPPKMGVVSVGVKLQESDTLWDRQKLPPFQ